MLVGSFFLAVDFAELLAFTYLLPYPLFLN